MKLIVVDIATVEQELMIVEIVLKEKPIKILLWIVIKIVMAQQFGMTVKFVF